MVDGPAWELEPVPARKKGQGESVQLSQAQHRLSKCGNHLTDHVPIVLINKSMPCTDESLVYIWHSHCRDSVMLRAGEEEDALP